MRCASVGSGACAMKNSTWSPRERLDKLVTFLASAVTAWNEENDPTGNRYSGTFEVPADCFEDASPNLRALCVYQALHRIAYGKSSDPTDRLEVKSDTDASHDDAIKSASPGRNGAVVRINTADWAERLLSLAPTEGEGLSVEDATAAAKAVAETLRSRNANRADLDANTVSAPKPKLDLVTDNNDFAPISNTVGGPDPPWLVAFDRDPLSDAGTVRYSSLFDLKLTADVVVLGLEVARQLPGFRHKFTLPREDQRALSTRSDSTDGTQNDDNPGPNDASIRQNIDGGGLNVDVYSDTLRKLKFKASNEGAEEDSELFEALRAGIWLVIVNARTIAEELVSVRDSVKLAISGHSGRSTRRRQARLADIVTQQLQADCLANHLVPALRFPNKFEKHDHVVQFLAGLESLDRVGRAVNQLARLARWTLELKDDQTALAAACTVLIGRAPKELETPEAIMTLAATIRDMFPQKYLPPPDFLGAVDSKMAGASSLIKTSKMYTALRALYEQDSTCTECKVDISLGKIGNGLGFKEAHSIVTPKDAPKDDSEEMAPGKRRYLMIKSSNTKYTGPIRNGLIYTILEMPKRGNWGPGSEKCWDLITWYRHNELLRGAGQIVTSDEERGAIQFHPWFHGPVDDRAEVVNSKYRKAGAYLVRPAFVPVEPQGGVKPQGGVEPGYELSYFTGDDEQPNVHHIVVDKMTTRYKILNVPASGGKQRNRSIVYSISTSTLAELVDHFSSRHKRQKLDVGDSVPSLQYPIPHRSNSLDLLWLTVPTQELRSVKLNAVKPGPNGGLAIPASGWVVVETSGGARAIRSQDVVEVLEVAPASDVSSEHRELQYDFVEIAEARRTLLGCTAETRCRSTTVNVHHWPELEQSSGDQAFEVQRGSKADLGHLMALRMSRTTDGSAAGGSHVAPLYRIDSSASGPTLLVDFLAHRAQPHKTEPPIFCFAIGTKLVVRDEGYSAVGLHGKTVTVLGASSEGCTCAVDNSQYPASTFVPRHLNWHLARSFSAYCDGDTFSVLAFTEFVTCRIKRHIAHSRYLVELLSQDLCDDEHDAPNRAVECEIDFNSANHFRAQLTSWEYKLQLTSYLDVTARDSARILDAITGRELDINKQLVEVEIEEIVSPRCDPNDLVTASARDASRETLFGEIRNVKQLCKALSGWDPDRRHGSTESRSVLIKAGAGTGKTWLTKQALHELATTGVEDVSLQFVPLLLPIQRLAYLRRTYGNPAARAAKAWQIQTAGRASDDTTSSEAIVGKSTTSTPDLIEWYIQMHFSSSAASETQKMLIDAYRSKRLLLLLDGLDEAVELAAMLTHFVMNSLIPGGHRVLLTSRPEGVSAELESYFRDQLNVGMHKLAVLNLKPYSAEQQRRVLKQQLSGDGATFIRSLFRFSEAHNKMDSIFGMLAAQEVAEAVLPVDRSQGVQQMTSLSTVVTSADDLIEAAEMARPAFRAGLAKLCTEHGSGMGIFDSVAKLEEVGNWRGIVIADTKTKDSIVRKAEMKYQELVMKGTIAGPTFSWVYDASRCAIVCESLEEMVRVSELLEAAGGPFKLIRRKNYFKHLDPTHYRRFGCVVSFDADNGATHLAEIQIHVSPIWKFVMVHPELMHEPYEKFRKVFGRNINNDLNSSTGWLSLELRIKTWHSFLRVPVLMALLVVVMDGTDFQKPSIKDVPNSKVQLYSKALGIITSTRVTGAAQCFTLPSSHRVVQNFNQKQYLEPAEAVLRGLSLIAHANHFDGEQGRRDFNLKDAKKAITAAKREENTGILETMLELFYAESDDQLRIPTLKILTDGGMGRSERMIEVQSVHMSLQEYLAAMYVFRELLLRTRDQSQSKTVDPLGVNPVSKEGIFTFLKSKRHKNFLTFCAQLGVGRLLFGRARIVDLSGCGIAAGNPCLDFLTMLLEDRSFAQPAAAHVAWNYFRSPAPEFSQQVHTLDFSFNAVDLTDSLMKDVIGRILSKCELRTIRLGWNPLGNDGAAVLTSNLAAAPQLFELDLSGCSVQLSNSIATELAAWASAPVSDTSVPRVLFLNFNPVGPQGADKLAAALLKNRPKPVAIHLRRCFIQHAGANAIGRCLTASACGGLLLLDLAENDLRAAGGLALGIALKGNTTIATLELFGNGIGSESAAVLIQNLRPNGRLKCLGLGLNDISVPTVEGPFASALADLIRDAPGLQKLDMQQNWLPESTCSALMTVGTDSKGPNLDINFTQQYIPRRQAPDVTQRQAVPTDTAITPTLLMSEVWAGVGEMAATIPPNPGCWLIPDTFRQNLSKGREPHSGYYFGSLSEVETMDLLNKPTNRRDGAFLLRDYPFPGKPGLVQLGDDRMKFVVGYILSVRSGRQITNWRVLRRTTGGSGWVVDASRPVDMLTDALLVPAPELAQTEAKLCATPWHAVAQYVTIDIQSSAATVEVETSAGEDGPVVRPWKRDPVLDSGCLAVPFGLAGNLHAANEDAPVSIPNLRHAVYNNNYEGQSPRLVSVVTATAVTTEPRENVGNAPARNASSDDGHETLEQMVGAARQQLRLCPQVATNPGTTSSSAATDEPVDGPGPTWAYESMQLAQHEVGAPARLAELAMNCKHGLQGLRGDAGRCPTCPRDPCILGCSSFISACEQFDHVTVCPKATVPCPYGCGHGLSRGAQALQLHLRNGCPARPQDGAALTLPVDKPDSLDEGEGAVLIRSDRTLLCAAGCGSMIAPDEADDHAEICRAAWRSCPYGCGDLVRSRDPAALEAHKRTACSGVVLASLAVQTLPAVQTFPAYSKFFTTPPTYPALVRFLVEWDADVVFKAAGSLNVTPQQCTRAQSPFF